MAVSNRETAALIKTITSKPGWRIDENSTHYAVLPPAGKVIHFSRMCDPRDLRMAVAALRRAGLYDEDERQAKEIKRIRKDARESLQRLKAENDRLKESAVTPQSSTTGGGSASPRVVTQQSAPPGALGVVESAPATRGGPGITELLLEDGSVVYGCAESECSNLRFKTFNAVCGHRASHSIARPVTPPAGPDRVVDFLREAVHAGRYGRPGSQIPGVGKLAADLGVTQGVVRAAIVTLNEENLLQSFPNEGTFILAKPEPCETETAMPTPKPAGDLQREMGAVVDSGDPIAMLKAAQALIAKAMYAVAESTVSVSSVSALEDALAKEKARSAAMEARIEAMTGAARMLMGSDV